ncbi:hypothetical protein lbkm_4223 [Lachnospiraceae bacterium KM106-2]|nr:hypothetical protein lbkm_4223 [Lachnospiraceae bacterium KM106-2]
MTGEFPYGKYQNTELWNLVEKAIEDLVENDDLEERTAREYIVGYLCKTVVENKW